LLNLRGSAPKADLCQTAISSVGDSADKAGTVDIATIGTNGIEQPIQETGREGEA
jgi:hypothetical protein